MSLFDAMEQVVFCPRCGAPMLLQGDGPGEFPYLECPDCGVCFEVRV